MKLISTIILNDQANYQSIYASQVYGTFFVIYGKVTLKDKTEDTYSVEKMDLLLVNYKGLINLGLTDCKYEYDSKTQSAILKVEVQALHANKKLSVLFNGDVFSKNGNSHIDVDRRVLRMKPEGGSMSGQVFDNEFYFREGVKTPDGANIESDDYDFEVDSRVRGIVPKEFQTNAVEASEGGKKCPKSRNNVG